MPDTLAITIIFIILSTLVGAFIKGRMRDKCLMSFEGDLINIELKDNRLIWGVLDLEATGLELKYKEPYRSKGTNNIEKSFVLYKNEYANIQCITRNPDRLDAKSRKKREQFLKRAGKKKGLMSLKRRIRNVFATVRDSVMEVVNLLMGKVKQASPMGGTLSSQDKYVSKMQTGMFSTMNTSFEPLLEKHMGKKVVLQLTRGDKLVEYLGILKGYTAEFIELVDLPYQRNEGEGTHTVDIIVSRSVGIIRHLSE